MEFERKVLRFSTTNPINSDIGRFRIFVEKPYKNKKCRFVSTHLYDCVFLSPK